MLLPAFLIIVSKYFVFLSDLSLIIDSYQNNIHNTYFTSTDHIYMHTYIPEGVPVRKLCVATLIPVLFISYSMVSTHTLTPDLLSCSGQFYQLIEMMSALN